MRQIQHALKLFAEFRPLTVKIYNTKNYNWINLDLTDLDVDGGCLQEPRLTIRIRFQTYKLLTLRISERTPILEMWQQTRYEYRDSKTVFSAIYFYFFVNFICRRVSSNFQRCNPLLLLFSIPFYVLCHILHHLWNAIINELFEFSAVRSVCTNCLPP